MKKYAGSRQVPKNLGCVINIVYIFLLLHLNVSFRNASTIFGIPKFWRTVAILILTTLTAMYIFFFNYCTWTKSKAVIFLSLIYNRHQPADCVLFSAEINIYTYIHIYVMLTHAGMYIFSRLCTFWRMPIPWSFHSLWTFASVAS